MLLLTFIFGLIIGSFLNVLIYRIPRKESIILPRSHCVACGHELGILDLVPLASYLLLRGKCRYCGVKVSPLYPVVELITAIVFTVIFIKGGLTTWTAVGFIFTAILIVGTFTDITTGLIPDKLTYPGIIIGLLLSSFTIGFKLAFFGSLGFAITYLLIVFISRGGMGGGDVKLAAVIGAFLGPLNSFLVFIISALLAFIGVIPLLISGTANRKTAIRFGPFLAIAAWVVFMFSNEIITFYLKLINM